MAENELLDLPRHPSWRRLRRLVEADKPATEIIEEALYKWGGKLKKINEPTVKSLIEAAQSEDAAKLRNLVRACDGVELDFARLVQAEYRGSISSGEKVTLTRVISVLQRCWMDQFQSIMEKSPALKPQKEDIQRHVRSRLKDATEQWATALVTRQPSHTFPRPRRAHRPKVDLHSSLLDSPVRRQSDESAHRNR